MNTCTFKKTPQLLQKIYKCTRKQNSNTKLGHTHACYIDVTLCKMMILLVKLTAVALFCVNNFFNLNFILLIKYNRIKLIG